MQPGYDQGWWGKRSFCDTLGLLQLPDTSVPRCVVLPVPYVPERGLSHTCATVQSLPLALHRLHGRAREPPG
jgi:hypothetical protein